jgi:hypothetical protein
MRTITTARRRTTLALLLALTLFAGFLDAPAAKADDAITPADRTAVVQAWLQGGPEVRAAAATALTGTDEQIKQFLTGDYPAARLVDQRDAVAAAIADGGPSVRGAAQRALTDVDAGNANALAIFLDSGWQNAANIDLRLQVNQLMATGGANVREAAQIALDSEDPEVLQEFADSGWQTQWRTDLRLKVNNVMAAGGPEVKAAAQKALDDGSPEALDQFLTYGWDVASAHDDETTTLTDLLAQAQAAADEVDRETANAKEQAARAAAGAAAAKRSAQEAAAATAEAQSDSKRAATSAQRAATAARKAAQSAQVAIDAASSAGKAARTASLAAARASRAASKAAGATADAYKAAANAALDANGAANARAVAEQTNRWAQSAKDLALKAAHAGDAIKASMASVDSANAAAADATAAAAANDEAVKWATKAGANAQQAINAAKAARASAARAVRAANAARTYMQSALTNAYAARDAANEAAADAERAAAAAIDAADHATDAADAANKATDYAAAATAAAGQVADLAAKAVEVYNAARAADTERLQVATDEALDAAREAAADYEATQAQAHWDTEQAAQRDAETNRLIAEALNPQTDPALALTDARTATLALAEAKGTWTRQAAQDALGNGGDATLTFLRTGVAEAAAEDNRLAVLDIATSENTKLAAAAQAALDTDDATIAQFLRTQNYTGRFTEDRLKVNNIMAAARTAGRPVTVQKAQAALDADTLEALRTFLAGGQYTAAAIDDRLQVNNVMADPDSGPEVKAAAQVALDGPALTLPEFLRTGQYQAAERDGDNDAHLAVVNGLIEQLNELATTALQRAQEAQSVAARARGDATKATEYANQAIHSAEKAAGHANTAATWANKAAVSAQKAARSAQSAKSAATRANTSVRSAVRSATWAQMSYAHAADSAREAGRVAELARNSAIAAGKDAAAAQKAASEAYTSYKSQRAAEIGGCETKFLSKVNTNLELAFSSPMEAYRNCVMYIVGGLDELARKSYTYTAICNTYYKDESSQQFKDCLHSTINPEFRWESQLTFISQVTTGLTAMLLPAAVGMGGLCVVTVVCGAVVGTLFGLVDVGLNVYRYIKGDQSLATTALKLGENVLETVAFNGAARLLGVTFKSLKVIYYAGIVAKKTKAELELTNLTQAKADRWVQCLIGATANSFAPETPVLLADGSTKPISDIRVGDRVLAADPETGRPVAEPVTATHQNIDADLTDVAVRQPSGGSEIVHTTARHPFWNVDLGEWTDAGDLRTGTRLTGGSEVASVRTFGGLRRMFNLSVADVHTFFVLVGSVTLLVHNLTEEEAQRCGHIVLGLERPRSGVGNDALAEQLTKSGDWAGTYNGDPWGNPDPGKPGQVPRWVNMVWAAINDPNTKLSITLDGLDGAADDMSAAQKAYARFQDAARRAYGVKERDLEPGMQTSWELAQLAFAFQVGNRGADSVEFYVDGKNVSAELRELLPTDDVGWYSFRKP